MAKEVKMPQISEDAESGTIVEILVKKGDRIEEEQAIVAVESDKASVEVPSSEAGTVQEIKVSEGDELQVGDVILILSDENGAEEDEESDSEDKESKDSSDDDSEDEEATSDQEEPSAEKEKKPDKKEKKEQPEKESQEAEASSEDESEETQPEEQEKEKTKQRDKKPEQKGEVKGQTSEESQPQEVPAAPSVRRLARELEVDIYQVAGSGPGDRITADDVRAYADGGQNGKPKKSPTPSQTPTELPDFSKWGPVQREKISSIRRVTAQSMAQAWNIVPHVTQFDQADVTDLDRRNEPYAAQVEKAGGKLTPTASLLKVTVAALQAFPKFNASLDLDNEELIFKQYYHIGVAVDTEEGLLVPVIRDVNRKSVVDLSIELPEIAAKAREGKLSGDEMQGGTFTLSNLGGIGGTNFTPIVYHPQVAILGVSRTQTQPVWTDDRFEPRAILPLSLSYDHRVIDGAEAARFLRWICRALEDPFTALMG